MAPDKLEVWGVKVRLTDSASAAAAVEWLTSNGREARRQSGTGRLAAMASSQSDADALASQIQERWPDAEVEVRGD